MKKVNKRISNGICDEIKVTMFDDVSPTVLDNLTHNLWQHVFRTVTTQVKKSVDYKMKEYFNEAG